MARQRRRHENRWSVWTFVAPVALIVAAVIVVTVLRDAIDSRHAGAKTTAGASTTGRSTKSGTTTAVQAPRRKRIHVVASGETLSDIAQRFGTTVSALVKLNPSLKPDQLQPGQRIRVS